MNRLEINVQTNERKVIQLTNEESAEAQLSTKQEAVKREIETIEELKIAAEQAELVKLIDLEKGITPEAVAYRAAKKALKA